MFRRHNNIVYRGRHNFLFKNGLYKNVCNVIRFRGNQKYRKHVNRDAMQNALSPSTAILWFISDETIHQNKSWSLIPDLDGCFIYVLHKIAIYRHFSYFQDGFQNGGQRSVLNPYTLNIQESLIHVWHWGIGFLRWLAA